MRELFTETTINGMALKNRFMRSATWEGLATADGAVTDSLKDMMISLARGGVGLIISSHAYVAREGQGTPWQLGIYDDSLVPGLREMASAVHGAGGKIVLQLAHAGEFAEPDLIKQPAWSVSAASGLTTDPLHVVTEKDIDQLVTAFARAAKRAKEAGFDGVQVHAAHGYFLSQFLSPAFNRRTDAYGGTVDNRARIHCRIIRAIRDEVGAGFPILMKMNGADFMDNGLEVEESVQAAALFAEAGVDAMEVSGGVIKGGDRAPSMPGITSQAKEAYFRDYARRFKADLDIPLILVGGIKSLEVASQVIDEGVADYISMSRCLIREPDLVKRWQNGDRRPALCTSDNLCFSPGFEGKGVYCVTRELEERKARQ